jgi:hypothetical protein
MLIEIGNHSAKGDVIDDAPKVTTIHIPEADDGSTHPDAVYDGPHPHSPADDGTVGSLVTPGPALGGYTHEIGGIKVADLKEHLMDAILMRDGTTNLPGHEILLSILHPSEGAWMRHGAGLPAWVRCLDHHGLTPDGRSKDIEKFLTSYWGAPTAEQYFDTKDPTELALQKELTHWTRHGAPGQLPTGLSLPDATALFTNNGRVISNVNDGGGQVGAIGAGTAATSTTFTTASTFTLNQWAGYRVVVYSTTSNNMVWGNVVSNTSGANSVLTVDRWYVAATPGGSAGTTPTTPWGFMILDGGFTSTWFVGLATGANAPVATDTTLSTNGNAEITTGGGGLIRKIAPYAQTSGVASRAITLTPVFTANGTDSLPATVTTIGALCSMVVGTVGTMKFETALNASATLSASGDQLTVTETITGS